MAPFYIKYKVLYFGKWVETGETNIMKLHTKLHTKRNPI